MKQFFVKKREGDYSDILLGKGVAELVKKVFEQNDIEGADIWIKDKVSFYLVESEKDIKESHFSNLHFETLYPLIFYDKMDEKPSYTSDVVDFTMEKKYKDWTANKKKSSLIRQSTGIPLSNKIMNDLYEIKDYFSEIVQVILKNYNDFNSNYKELLEEIDTLFDKIQIEEFKEIVKSKLLEEEL